MKKYVQEHCKFPHCVWATQHNILLHLVQHYPKSLSSQQSTHQIQKQQRRYIHININNPSAPQESLQHVGLRPCV